MEKQNINSSKDKEKNSSRRKGMKDGATPHGCLKAQGCCIHTMDPYTHTQYLIDNKTVSVHVDAA